jgi:hypothetical protein
MRDKAEMMSFTTPVLIPQQTLYARNDSTWRASFSSVW